MFRLWRSEKCQYFRQDLSAYIDNRLDGAAQARLEEHLSRCLACRTELESLRQTVGLLRQLPAASSPRSFAIPGPEPARRFVPVMALRVAASVAAMLLALVFAIDMSNLFEGRPATRTPVAVTTPTPAVEAGPSMAVAPVTQPAPTPSPLPATPETTPEPTSLKGPAGPAGPAEAVKPTAVPETTPTPTVRRGMAMGVATPIPTPLTAPTSMPQPMAAVERTPAEQPAPVVPEPTVSAGAEPGTEAAFAAGGPAATGTAGRSPLRQLEWALLAVTLALAAAAIISGRLRYRKEVERRRYK